VPVVGADLRRERKKYIKKTNKKKKKNTCTQEEYDRVGGIKSY
jgi:hypothetical protein